MAYIYCSDYCNTFLYWKWRMIIAVNYIISLLHITFTSLSCTVTCYFIQIKLHYPPYPPPPSPRQPCKYLSVGGISVQIPHSLGQKAIQLPSLQASSLGRCGSGMGKGRRACNYISRIWLLPPIPQWLPVDWAVKLAPINTKRKRVRM